MIWNLFHLRASPIKSDVSRQRLVLVLSTGGRYDYSLVLAIYTWYIAGIYHLFDIDAG